MAKVSSVCREHHHPAVPKRRSKTVVWRVLAGFMLLSLVACSTFDSQQATPTISTSISQQKAIASALEIASHGGVEINGTLVEPTNVRAESTTFGNAMERFTGSAEVPVGENPDTPVWLVTMEGLWTGGFPMPTDTPTAEPYHHFVVVLDANTGGLRFLSARP
jgi:hypothetical protein